MILPVGFGKKIPGFSPVTYGIIFAIALISVPAFDQLNQAEKKALQSPEYQNYKTVLLETIQADCPKKLGQGSCTQAKRLVDIVFTEKSRKNDPGPLTNEEDVGRSLASVEEESPEETSSVPDKKVSGKRKKQEYRRVVSQTREAQKYLSTLMSEDLDVSKSEFSALILAKKEFKSEYTRSLGEIGVLNSEDMKLIPTLKSIFLHGGWLHLIGNLLVFFFFARLVEARIGSYLMFLVFLLGGAFGLWFEGLLKSGEAVPILGASSGVSALIGGFYVSFYHRRMRVILMNPMAWFNREDIMVPVSWSIPIVYVLIDILGLASVNPETANVAHWAHLGGFVFGAAATWSIEKSASLSKQVLFSKEEELLMKFSKDKEIESLLEVLQMNPDSLVALKNVIRHFVARGDFTHPELRTSLTNCWAFLFKLQDWSSLLRVLNELPPELPLLETVSKVGQNTLIGTGKVALKEGDWQVGLRAYGLLAEKYAGPKNSQKIYDTLKGLITIGQESDSGRQWTQQWFQSLRHQDLKTLLSTDFTNLNEGKPI